MSEMSAALKGAILGAMSKHAPEIPVRATGHMMRLPMYKRKEERVMIRTKIEMDGKGHLHESLHKAHND